MRVDSRCKPTMLNLRCQTWQNRDQAYMKQTIWGFRKRPSDLIRVRTLHSTIQSGNKWKDTKPSVQRKLRWNKGNWRQTSDQQHQWTIVFARSLNCNMLLWVTKLQLFLWFTCCNVETIISHTRKSTSFPIGYALQVLDVYTRCSTVYQERR